MWQVATMIASHPSEDGHCLVHFDPAQCRNLTMRAALRLQTVPRFFAGPRAEQYHQPGNAGPAMLAQQIAKFVVEVLGSVWGDR